MQGDKSGTIDADGNPNSTGWPTCPTPGYQATRRKRSVFDDRLDDLPDTVDTEFTVRLGGGRHDFFTGLDKPNFLSVKF